MGARELECERYSAESTIQVGQIGIVPRTTAGDFRESLSEHEGNIATGWPGSRLGECGGQRTPKGGFDSLIGV